MNLKTTCNSINLIQLPNYKFRNNFLPIPFAKSLNVFKKFRRMSSLKSSNVKKSSSLKKIKFSNK